MISQPVIKELTNILGREYILTGLDDLTVYSHDATNQVFFPDIVAFPEDIEQISRIVKIANREHFPVIPRGAGTGMSGGALAVRGGLIMAMERLNRILLIDRDNLIAKVQPGVITGNFQEEVEKHGLFYPPDPASMDTSTIGGNVAVCAGGPRAFKYGVTRDYVLGLKIVTPTGEILNVGVETAKGVVGYDLTRLVVGSEGTLAIITEITLRLVPKPESKKTMLAIFPDIISTAKCVSSIIRKSIIPTTIEFMDSLSVECVRDQLAITIPKGGTAILIIEVDGDRVQIDRDLVEIESVCRQLGVIEVQKALNNKEAEALWRVRRELSQALLKVRPHKINYDVVVPIGSLAEFVIALSDIGKKFNLLIPSFGHAGDGNIHVNIMYSKDDMDESRRVQKALKEILRLVIDLKGTLSGEHGVGLSKKPYIGMEISESSLMLMRGIKKVFDPNGILNPGKIFNGV